MSTAKGLASGSLHSATEKGLSTMEAVVKKSTPTIQKCIIGPAGHSKEYLKIGSTMVTRLIKSEMSLARIFFSLAMVLVVLGRMTVSDLSYNVTQDKVVMTKFKVHPPTPRSALSTGIGAGLVSILLTLVIPPAFGYVRVHALGPCCSGKKLKEPTSDLDSNTDDRSTSSPSLLTIPPFEASRKQTSKTSTGGGGRRTTAAAAGVSDAAVATAKKGGLSA
ncbi:hypothetical protein BGZ95_008514 [Linnemannia exigua]|uniref:Uncharacterized protein n=1 Tax=Linnemannia exigua TaxID=604196 RepID=A0AAD4DG59_9FUNG|nr:hypothetical protein BGZ95_008514 [Linnemannia exigua]